MLTKQQIRQMLANQDVQASNSRIVKTAQTLGLGDRYQYEDDEAQQIINRMKVSSKPVGAAMQAEPEAVEQHQTRSEGAIANVVQAKMNHINDGAAGLARKLEAYEDQIATAIVNRLDESQPRIYALIEQKLSARRADDFSLELVIEESAFLPDLSGGFRFAENSIAGCLPVS